MRLPRLLSLCQRFVSSSSSRLTMASKAFEHCFDKDPKTLSFDEKKYLITRNLQARATRESGHRNMSATCVWVSECMCEWVSGWICEWVINCVCEWLCKWVSDCVWWLCECMKVIYLSFSPTTPGGTWWRNTVYHSKGASHWYILGHCHYW